MSAGRSLQEAVFAALVADAEFEDMIGGAKVFDSVPRNAAAPYVHLGEMVCRDWSTATEAGAEISFAVAVWSRGEGRSEGFQIAERVVTLLHDVALTLDGWRLVNLRHLATETARLEKPEGRRTVVRFRAVVEPG
jgi:hypothetical protein